MTMTDAEKWQNVVEQATFYLKNEKDGESPRLGLVGSLRTYFLFQGAAILYAARRLEAAEDVVRAATEYVDATCEPGEKRRAVLAALARYEEG